MEKMDEGNYAKWRVTFVSGVGADPAFLPGHCLAWCRPPWRSALWHMQPPQTSPASEPEDGPLHNKAQGCEFG